MTNRITGDERWRRELPEVLTRIEIMNLCRVCPTHEPAALRVTDPRSGPRLCEAQRFMAPTHVQFSEVLPFHEPESGLPAIQRLTQTRFMAPTHVRILEVFALHEPTPHPFPLPIRWGEGGRRSGEGVVHGLNACEKQKGAFLEPVGARVRRALISVVVRSGLVGVSPHRSRTQCVVARSWKLSENLPSPAPECSKNNSRC